MLFVEKLPWRRRYCFFPSFVKYDSPRLHLFGIGRVTSIPSGSLGGYYANKYLVMENSRNETILLRDRTDFVSPHTFRISIYRTETTRIVVFDTQESPREEESPWVSRCNILDAYSCFITPQVRRNGSSERGQTLSSQSLIGKAPVSTRSVSNVKTCQQSVKWRFAKTDWRRQESMIHYEEDSWILGIVSS